MDVRRLFFVHFDRPPGFQMITYYDALMSLDEKREPHPLLLFITCNRTIATDLLHPLPPASGVSSFAPDPLPPRPLPCPFPQS